MTAREASIRVWKPARSRCTAASWSPAPSGSSTASGCGAPARGQAGRERAGDAPGTDARGEALAREQRVAADRRVACGHDPASFQQMAPASEHEIVEVSGREVRVSNPGKLYFPAVKITKLDLVSYYVECEEAVVRGLRERPTVMKRWVDGVEGKPFFQKRVPDSAPEWLETATVTFPSGRHAARARPERRRPSGLGREPRRDRLEPVAGAPRRPRQPR